MRAAIYLRLSFIRFKRIEIATRPIALFSDAFCACINYYLEQVIFGTVLVPSSIISMSLISLPSMAKRKAVRTV